MIEKSLLVVLGVAVAGFVGYEIVKRQKPEWIKKAKKSMSEATNGVSKAFKNAQASFMEGYASA